MKIQILSSFKGDNIRDIDTSSKEGRGSAAKLIADLIKSGSALFLEKEINEETYTYRVAGYDADRDKIKLLLHPGDKVPEGAKVSKYRGSKGKTARRIASVESSFGPMVSLAPVSGGNMTQEEAQQLADSGITWEAIRYGISTLAEERGWHHGVPLPSSWNTDHRIVLARGTPFSEKWGYGRPVQVFPSDSVRVCSNHDVDNDDYLTHVNSWTPEPTTVEVFRDKKGTFKLRMPNAHIRLRFWVDTMAIRQGCMEWDSEFKAMESLRDKITEAQWKSYILSGAFPEYSERSRVTYIFRKGLPTIAMTERPREDGKIQRNFLAALCLHGLGYYENTWTGCQPPTDDVITALLLMRSDEHLLWKKSGQHALTDPRAGI